MLVLSRRPGERIHIGSHITVSVLEIQGKKVRLGIDAPRDVSILRPEAVHRERQRDAPLGTPRRILIVDDSPEDREAFRCFMTAPDSPKYVFSEADCAQEGLALCRAALPDCILLDYRLPDLDGLEFLQELRQEQGDCRIPVIMLTGQGAEAVAVRALKSGVNDYLVKGDLSRELLQRAVREALGGGSAGRNN